MRFLIKMQIPNEQGNERVKDRHFGEKIQELLKDLNAETAYFTTINGERGGYIVVNYDDPSRMVKLAEPLFFWFNAKVEFIPVMLPEDLQKSGPSIQAAVDKWIE